MTAGPYRTTVSCSVCGVLGTGLTTDPPTRPKPANWKGTGDGTWRRWDELDALADKHGKVHPTHVTTVPAERGAA